MSIILPVAGRTVGLPIRIPPNLRRGLVWAPDLLRRVDLVGGGRGTLDGSTYSAAYDGRSFNGATDRVDFPNVRDFGTTPAPSSGAFWIYPTSVGAGLFNIWQASSAALSQSVVFRRNADGIEFTHASTATPLRTISSTGLLVVNTWYHVGYSYDASGLSAGGHLYLNGTETSYQVGANLTGTPRAADGPWSIGGRVESDANNFAGRLRQPLIWDRILSAAEFATLAGLPRPA